MSSVSNTSSSTSNSSISDLSSSTDKKIDESIESGPIGFQQDSVVANWITSSHSYIYKTKYEGTSADHPKLPSPLEGEIQPSAVEPAVQDIVRAFIVKEILDMLAPIKSPQDQNAVFNYLTKETPLEKPDLVDLANLIKERVETRVKKEARLENFTLSALHTPNKESWIQSPLSPYTAQQKEEILNFFQEARNSQLDELILLNDPPISTEQISLLNTALSGGKTDLSVKYILEKIDAAAISETQKKYGLSFSWTPNATEPNYWKPVNFGLTTPKNIADARYQRLTKNVETSTTGFLDAIMDSVWRFRQQIEDAMVEMGLEMEYNIEVQAANQDIRTDLAMENAEKNAEAQKRQRILGDLSFAMKIIGPTLAALAIMSSIVMIGLSAGAATPLAIAGLVAGVTMLAYSITESATGITSEAITWMKDTMDDLLSDVPEALVPYIQIAAVILVVAAVALIIAATASTGNAAAAANVTRTVGKFLLQAGAVYVRQMAVQASIIFLMSSGLLLEIPRGILTNMNRMAESLGVEKEILNEKVIDILSFIIFTLEALALMVISAKTMQLGSAPSPEGGGLKNTLGKAAEGLKKEWEGLLAVLDRLKNRTGQTVQNTVPDGFNPIASLKNFAKEKWDVAKYMYNYDLEADLAAGKAQYPLASWDDATTLTKPFFDRATWQKRYMPFNRLAQLAQPAVLVPSMTVQAITQFQLARIHADQAEMEKINDEIAALLEFLDDVLNQLQTSISNQGESLQTISRYIDQWLQLVSQGTTKLTSSIQG